MDSEGCQNSFETTIIEPTELSGTASSSPSTSNNGSISITPNGGTSPYTYSIDGVNYYSGSLFTSLSGGIYTVYIQDNNLCIQQITIEVEDFTSIDEFDVNQTSFNLFPNPTNGVFTLRIAGCKGTNYNAQIFNHLGQHISSFEIQCQNESFEKEYVLGEKFSSGNYYIGIYNSTSHQLISFVKL